MNGPQHYREAEALVVEFQRAIGSITRSVHAHGVGEEIPIEVQCAVALLDAAKVHAALAQVAATIESVAARGPGDVKQVWVEVTE